MESLDLCQLYLVLGCGTVEQDKITVHIKNKADPIEPKPVNVLPVRLEPLRPDQRHEPVRADQNQIDCMCWLKPDWVQSHQFDLWPRPQTALWSGPDWSRLIAPTQPTMSNHSDQCIVYLSINFWQIDQITLWFSITTNYQINIYDHGSIRQLWAWVQLTFITLHLSWDPLMCPLIWKDKPFNLKSNVVDKLGRFEGDTTSTLSIDVMKGLTP